MAADPDRHIDGDGDDARLLAMLRLNMVPGVGPLLASRLLEAFDGDPLAIFAASRSAWTQVRGVGPKVADGLADRSLIDAAQAEHDTAFGDGIAIITIDDSLYPARLREIPDPPLVLYVRGAENAAWHTATAMVAIVGSRSSSYYGRDQAARFGSALARAGLVTVSGFARGIDTQAHIGTLDAGGATIAVIGSGLHEIYPPENRDLVGRVVEKGALISEYPLKTPPHASNFPRRNRILAGMTEATLVIEAGVKSGAMITARLAMEYDRDVLAIPGRIDDERSAGCNGLIRDGAALIGEPAHVLVEMGLREDADKPPARSRPRRSRTTEPNAAAAETDAPPLEPPKPTGPPPALSDDERRVWEALTAEPTGIDTLSQASGLPTGKTLGALTMLEIKGHARQLAGRHYIRA